MSHDAQLKADAAERARLKADAKAAREARICALWRNRDSDATMQGIAEAAGVTPNVASAVLARHGLREPGHKVATGRRTLGRAIRKARGGDDT